MSLTNFAVCPILERYKTVAIVADDGDERIVAYIQPEELDDFFPDLQFADRDRVLFVTDNLRAFRGIIASKYERGEWKSDARSGCNIRRLEIDLADLRFGPPLFSAE
jgi:hypothetical protein